MASKKTLYHFHSLARVLLVPVILVAANVLLTPITLRWDLTANKQYTLGEASRRVLSELTQPVTVKIFFSRELPEELIGIRQDVHDLVSEYQRFGRGKLLVETFDPKDDQATKDEAERLGVPEVQFNSFGTKKLEISSGYAGLVVGYLEKNEVLPVINATTNLEYDLTLAIRRLTREKLPALGIATGHGETLDPAVRQALTREYQVTDVQFANGALSPGNVDGLLMVGPTTVFTSAELFALDQFVMKGGKLLVFADGVSVDEQQAMLAEPNQTNLNTLLTAWGVTINADVVADPQSPEILAFDAGGRRVLAAYPVWPKIVQARGAWQGLNGDHPITGKISSITFPWPSSLTVMPNDERVIVLGQTSPQGGAFATGNGPLFLTPDAVQQIPPGGPGAKVVAALIQGKLASAFAGKPVPDGVTVKTDDVAGSTENGAGLVVGNSRFLTVNMLQQAPENMVLLGNGLDAMLQDASLIEIRSRSSVRRPLKAVTEQQAAGIRYGNIFGGSALVAGGGLLAMLIRPRATAKAIARYSGAK